MNRAMLWGAIAISALTLIHFSAMCLVLVWREVPPHSEQAVLVLVGSLANSATLIVGFWVGSSAGSMQKTALLQDKP